MFTILIVAALFGVISMIAKIIKQQQCPTDEDLRSAILYRKTKNKGRDDLIITHLGICEKCREKVRAYNQE